MEKKRLLATGKPRLLRNINISLILDIIKDKGPISRADVARISGISPPTVSHVVGRLILEGIVEEVGFAASVGGRRPVLVRFDPTSSLVLGVDVAGSRCSAGLTDQAGHILMKEVIHYPSDGDEEPLTLVRSLVGRLLNRAPDGGGKVRGIGLGVPGFVDSRQGLVLLAAGLQWKNLALKKDLEDSFGLPVFVDNNVRTLLRGEKWFGQARGKDNAIYILIGIGIGAAIMIGGEIYAGTRQVAGEIRYTLLDRQALHLLPESLGFLEGRVAAAGVISRARQGWIEAATKTGLGKPDQVQLTVEGITSAAEKGDALAQKLTREMIEYLGMTVVNLSCLLDPEIVIFGGEVVEGFPGLLKELQPIVQRFCPYPPRLVVTELREDAGILGSVASLLAREKRTLSFQGL